MTSLLPAIEAEIKKGAALCEKATPGPWHQYEHDPVIICTEDDSSLGEMSPGFPDIEDAEILANAAFVAETRTAYPAAVALLKQAKAEIETNRWRDIETAPRDGSWILGWAQSDSIPYRISWGLNHRGALAWCSVGGSFVSGYITHWKHLDAPAQATEGDGK